MAQTKEQVQTKHAELLEKLDKLQEAITVLAEQIAVKEVEVKKESSREEIRTIEELFPVPSEYMHIAQQTLNKEFTIQVTPLSDSPAFQFTIVVPDKYSHISDEYRRMYKADLRPKVISYSDGAQGVRAWCERVFNSFNPTDQAMIVADRV